MWRLIFVASLALYINCKADSLAIADNRKSTTNLVESQDAILKAASNIGNAQNIDEMIKAMETFSRKFPAELLKDKSLRPISMKFKKSYDELVKQTRPMLRMASNLEKMGKEKSQKQLDVFAFKSTDMKGRFERIIDSMIVDSTKQRNRNLKIINNNKNDAAIIENAKRFVNITDTFSKCIQWIQSIPGKINCFIFGNCEANNEEDGNDDEGDGDGDIDEDDEDDGDEQVPDDEVNG